MGELHLASIICTRYLAGVDLLPSSLPFLRFSHSELELHWSAVRNSESYRVSAADKKVRGAHGLLYLRGVT